ncbi:MAG: hypothetical protein IT379_26405 [Deltaproteobacteria bacterium]|nr:hypothetical protein [Deltaproteobacteria bacterium]
MSIRSLPRASRGLRAVLCATLLCAAIPACNDARGDENGVSRQYVSQLAESLRQTQERLVAAERKVAEIDQRLTSPDPNAAPLVRLASVEGRTGALEQSGAQTQQQLAAQQQQLAQTQQQLQQTRMELAATQQQMRSMQAQARSVRARVSQAVQQRGGQ